MVKLLVIDPLSLEGVSVDGVVAWSSKSCFEKSLAGIEDLDFEVCAASDPDLCRKALTSDGVVLGGSEASAWEDTAFNDHLLDLIAICRHGEVPLLGICFGAQLLGRALGAQVGRNPEGMELGAPAIRLTAKGREHFLFRGVEGGCIWAVETHADAVLTLPPGCELLASTQHTPVQAFSYRGLLTGVQFHPEMDAGDLRALWGAFEEKGILERVGECERRVLAACECERASVVLRNFVERARVPVVSI